MKTNRLTFVLLLAVTLMACTGNKALRQEEVLTVKFPVKDEPKNIHNIHLIDSVDIISLDCEDIIGKIHKVMKYEDRYYLLDVSGNACVYIFSSSGTFIHKIDAYGQGPEEYIHLVDLFINPEEATFNLLSRGDKKLLRYTLDGKRLISVERLPKRFYSMLKTNEGFVAYMGNCIDDQSNPDNLWWLDEAFIPEGSWFPIEDESAGVSMNCRSLAGFEGNTYYIQEGDFNVYTVDEGVGSPRYAIDLDGQEATPEQEGANPFDNTIDALRSFQETANHLLVSFIYKGNYLMGVHQKSTGTSVVAALEPNDGTYFMSFGNVVGYDETAIYAVNSAASMKRFWNGKDAWNDFWPDHAQQIRNLRAKFESIDEEGNPFLIVYYVR
jgi:hypothetical protein